MKKTLIILLFILAAMFFVDAKFAPLFLPFVFAHCDTLDGPVVRTARIALEKGDVTPLLKWVRASDEKEITDAFNKTIAVRAKGSEAKELADMYFFETLVRIHRAGEGAPYTGLKPGETVDAAVALADKALESGSVDKLVDVLTKAMSQGIRERFQHAREAKKHADESVTAGREFVEKYIIFTHYVEGLHGIIKGHGGHHDAEAMGGGGYGH
ncbi:MAG TPA: DUF6448 family protein [Smithellaceae bacterium]|jgi:UDP-2,3-diacylglucosamine pyrophosphatase LpxH|nr:DUF6448 family protein [Smithellaceae bacterium]